MSDDVVEHATDNVPTVPPPPPVLRLSLEIVGSDYEILMAWRYLESWIEDRPETLDGFSLRAGPIVLDVVPVDAEEAPGDA